MMKVIQLQNDTGETAWGVLVTARTGEEKLVPFIDADTGEHFNAVSSREGLVESLNKIGIEVSDDGTCIMTRPVLMIPEKAPTAH